MKVFYFTSTGNSLYVAKKIGGEIISIPQASKKKDVVYEDDIIGFVFPCYWLNVPKKVREFIKENTFKANYMFALMTCGNMSGAAFELMEEDCNITLDYCNHIIMIDDYIYENGEINNSLSKDDELIDKEIEEVIVEIQNKTKKHFDVDLTTKEISRDMEYTELRDKSKEYDKTFELSDCIRCKTCEKVCPVGNIHVNEYPEFSHNCIGCLSCMHHCPQNAIRPKDNRGKLRYMNKNITLKEIIESNNQYK